MKLRRREHVERVYVNRLSGTAHRRRDCPALVDVPDGALRIVELGAAGEPLRLRACSRCWR